MIAVALGPSGYFGVGDIADARGGGGMFILRLGTKATETMQFLIEFDAGTFTDDIGQLDGLVENQHRVTAIGVQYYPAEVVWVRGGLGIADFKRAADTEMLAEALNERGLGFMTGVGYDVFRRGTFALDVELNLTGGIYGGAAMIHAGLALALNWY